MSHLVGILAFSSLIDHPGSEIAAKIVGRIQVMTPFAVEFARQSIKRANAM